MAKLYFRFGTMGSAKTLNLLAVAHNYEIQGKKVFIIKPSIDTRFGVKAVQSRAGLKRDADMCIKPSADIDFRKLEGVKCILVDECQFLTAHQVDQLRTIATEMNIPVICYGLRTNFKTHLFEGSKRLMEVADSIEEIKTTCCHCDKKAVFNIRVCADGVCKDGEEILVGCEEYKAVCSSCAARFGVI